MQDTSAMLRRPLDIKSFVPDLEEEIKQLAAEPTRAPLLVTRESTHGSFEDNAMCSQELKDTLRARPGWNHLTAIEREAMDQICLKFSRILSGKSMERQHWEDVRGYAALVEEKCI
jgi:hypothetical protein